jgi:hypothetical protein
MMGKAKPHKKLVRLAEKAELCATREEAQKLIRKADKAHAKLDT